MAKLFRWDRTVIGPHIRNVFVDKELERESNAQNLRIATSDKSLRLFRHTASVVRRRGCLSNCHASFKAS